MSTRFPKIPFGGSLSPKGPYPINARGYFESMEDALRAAKSAVPAGSGKGFYYIGQPLVVADLVHSQVYLCQITADRTLRVLGSGSSGDTADLERALAELTALVGDTSVSSQIEEALSGLKVADLSDAGEYITHSEVVNDLNTGGTDVPLSAEMGKNLYGSVNSIFSLCDSGTVYNAAHLGGVNASKYALKSELDAHNHDNVYAQLGHSHDISDVDGLNDRLGALEDSVAGLGSGGGSSGTTEPLVLTGNCYCSDEDIVSTTDTRLVFTVSLSGSTADDAYYTYYGMNGQTKRDIVIRLTNTYTPLSLGSTDFEPIVYVEAPVYKAAISLNSGTYYGVVATGTGYCTDPKYFYTVSVEYFTATATVTIEKHSNEGSGTSGGSSGSVSFPTPTEIQGQPAITTGAGWYYFAVIHNSVTYSLGLVYWGGASTVCIGCDSGYKVSIMSGGYTITYKDGSTLYDTHTLSVAKFG